MKRLVVPVLVLFVSLAVLAQEASQKSTRLPIEQAREQVAGMVAGISAQASCTFGSIHPGQTVYGMLSIDDCSSYDPRVGTMYADIYHFTAQAGHTYRLDVTSTLTYLAAFQDANSGAILWSTDTCGIYNNSCWISYTTPYSGTYSVGFAGVGTGTYTLVFADITQTAPPTPQPTPVPPRPTPPPSNGCGGPASLCLNNRFDVSIVWDAPGQGGIGNPYSLTGDTGYFWFFQSSNVEVTVKVLDARTINGHFWVFYGAMSNVHYRIAVKDTATGATRIYENPQGQMASAADTAAF